MVISRKMSDSDFNHAALVAARADLRGSELNITMDGFISATPDPPTTNLSLDQQYMEEYKTERSLDHELAELKSSHESKEPTESHVLFEGHVPLATAMAVLQQDRKTCKEQSITGRKSNTRVDISQDTFPRYRLSRISE